MDSYDGPFCVYCEHIFTASWELLFGCSVTEGSRHNSKFDLVFVRKNSSN
jgi:hypothetical protein